MAGRKEKAIQAGDSQGAQLGATIRAWRHHRGLSATELAKRARLGPHGRSYISKLEHGLVARMNDDHLTTIASALGISPQEILEHRGPDRLVRVGGIPELSPDGKGTSSLQQLQQVNPMLRELIPLVRELEPLLAQSVQQMQADFRRQAIDLLVERTPRIRTAWRQTEEADMFRDILRQAGRRSPIAALTRESHQPVSMRVGSIDPGRPVVEVTGVIECMRAAIQLVESVPAVSSLHFSQTESDPGEIFITWQGPESLIDAAADAHLLDEWLAAFRFALERGRKIVHLLHPEMRMQKALRVVHNILSLSGMRGDYAPYVLPRGWPQEQLDYIIVPQRGCLELSGLDTATYFPYDTQGYADRCAKVRGMVDQSTPLHTRFSRLDEKRSERFTDLERQVGDRYHVMNGLSESTVPFRIHETRADAVEAQKPEEKGRLKRLLNNRKEREQKINELLELWRFRDLCPASALTRYVETGIYAPDDTLSRLGAPHLDEKQRMDHLSALKMRLDRKNYDLILLPPSEEDFARISYVAKAGYGVLFECWEPTSNWESQPVTIEITEEAVVRAFYDNPFWQRVAAREAEDKENVKAILQEHINTLERRIAQRKPA